MVNSEYEYVKREFEFDRRLPPSNWIVVRIDGCHFHRFSKMHAFEKPNDENALRLMETCAMLKKFPDIVFAYGASDEYSFVFREETEFYNRRESLCLSGHINNQYNTCFWMLVKSGKSEQEAQLSLKGTSSKDKNELLAQQFQMNYDDELAMFRKGSSVYREKEEKVVKNDYGDPMKRTRPILTVAHVDIIGSEFWQNHQHILREEGKCRHEFMKQFDINHMLPPCNWVVVRINACQFNQFSFDKPNDAVDLSLMNESASLMMEQYPDIAFGYGFGSEYSFVFHEKTELYRRQESLILSSCSSYFTSLYMKKWKKFFPHKELMPPPRFEAEALCYPKLKILCEYLSSRQAECHTGNQYNTCFSMLVKSGRSEKEAHETLKGFFSLSSSVH
nr:unnamed protein product [Digitaria exilis]